MGQHLLAELDAFDVPILVVQDESDPFGTPSEGPNRTAVRATHSPGNGAAVTAAVGGWVAALTG